jgi:tetratricopeptide (TPR) repeat protein
VALQPAGPIVEVPPAILFRGQEAIGLQTADKSGAGREVVNPIESEPAGSLVDSVKRDLAARPNDPKVLNDAGAVIWAAGDKTQGAELLTKAHNAAPDDPVISYNLARTWYEQGRKDEAARLAEEAAQRQQDFDEARLLIAAAAVQQQDYDAADRQLKQLTKRLQAIALTIEGTVQLFKGQREEALKIFQQALALTQPQNRAAALYNVGLGFQQNGDLARATDYYQQAIGQSPALATAHYNLGTVLSQSGDLPQALEALREAQRLDPKNQSFLDAVARLASVLRLDMDGSPSESAVGAPANSRGGGTSEASGSTAGTTNSGLATPNVGVSGNNVPSFAGVWIATSEHGGVYRYQIGNDLTVAMLAVIKESDQDSWTEDNIPDASERALGALVQSIRQPQTRGGTVAGNCAPIKPMNPQEEHMIALAQQKSGCWVRQNNGQLVYVSADTPDTFRAPNSQGVASSWEAFEKDRKNLKSEIRRISSTVFEIRSVGSVPPPPDSFGSFSREVVARFDFSGSPARLTHTVSFWGSSRPSRSVRYTLARAQ